MGISAYVDMYAASTSESLLIITDEISSRRARDNSFLTEGNYWCGINKLTRSLFPVLAQFGDWEFALSIASDFSFESLVTGNICNGTVNVQQDYLYDEVLEEGEQPPYFVKIPEHIEKKAINNYYLRNFSWKEKTETEEYKNQATCLYPRGNLTPLEFEALRAHWLEFGFHFLKEEV